MLNTVLIAERANTEKPLPRLHVAADHPVERAAVEQLLRPLRNHPRRMAVLGLSAGAFKLPDPLANPVVEILDRIAADAEFYEVERHRP